MTGNPRHILLAVLAGALLWTGCGTRDPQSPKTEATRGDGLFHSTYDSDRIIVDSLRRDLDGDAIADLLVFSRDTGCRTAFDRVEVFSLDTAWARWRSRFVDPVDGASGYRFEDLTGDGRADLLVELNSGHMDPVLARGMNVYGLDASRVFTLLFTSSVGAPRIQEGRPASILTHGRYLGYLSASESPVFVTAVHVFRGTRYFVDTAGMRGYRPEARAIAARYSAAKKRPVTDSIAVIHLYRDFALHAMWTFLLDGREPTGRLWLQERTDLAALLPDSLFQDLQDFCSDPTEYHLAPSTTISRTR